ncbi:cold-shock protein [Enterococcus sp. 669A]|uniref:Cold-shock protein n=1 Tax=Candidatus Enterococcus moelleringii TaxID=2815325 RepID=A0ABS3LF49_9ENTE|nr:cold-shock protein [Enterococcus sp. 669A]MBO1306994.1 cold-shock protein [Enterococcus sp. 669A]
MKTGIVKWFDEAKGYGFITYDEDQEVFVHFTAIEEDGFKTLSQDEVVTFDIVEGARGAQAAHVKKNVD